MLNTIDLKFIPNLIKIGQVVHKLKREYTHRQSYIIRTFLYLRNGSGPKRGLLGSSCYCVYLVLTGMSVIHNYYYYREGARKRSLSRRDQICFRAHTASYPIDNWGFIPRE
jgi:hypothetical protein